MLGAVPSSLVEARGVDPLASAAALDRASEGTSEAYSWQAMCNMARQEESVHFGVK